MRVVGVFAKHWTPGRVKTRLAVSIGGEKAAAIHRALLAATLERLPDIGDRRLVVYTPEEHRNDFAKLAGDCWELWPQREGDLGTRMAAFFDEQFASGADEVVVFGSDCPHLPVERVCSDASRLTADRVLLGPADDGGYYVVAAREGTPSIFSGIAWGTSHVWRETLAAARRSGIQVVETVACFDIDNREDLDRLLRELEVSDGPALSRLRSKIVAILNED